MTDHTDLIARLRKGYEYGDSGVVLEAASALEAAQAEIEAQQHRIQSLWMERDVVRVERDQALARLAEIERQEPIGVVERTWAPWPNEGEVNIAVEWTNEANPPPVGTKLYAAAGASPVQPAKEHGRTNSGDETGGTVERFGWDISGAKPVVIPATNGAYVWYSDYLKLWKSVQPSQAQAALDAIIWYYENCTGSDSSISAFRQMVDRVVKMRPNFCESCAMDIATCDCVTPRPATVTVQPIQGLQSVADALTIEQLNDKVARLMAAQPSQAVEVSKQDIYDIAHRKATRYVCTAAPSDVMYGFSEMHLLDFVAAINAKESGK